MLRKLLKQNRYFKCIYKEQKGITGLETAIILIAFVVVAAVFAYTVLSAGLFSTQKSQEAVYSGLQETQNTLVVKGGVLSKADAKFADDCDTDVWTDGTNGVATVETTTPANIHEGSGSMALADSASAVDAETLVYSTSASMEVLANDTITFWAKLNNTSLTNKVGFGIHTTSTVSGGDTAILISATDTAWHLYSVDVVTGGTMYYGFYSEGAGVAETVYIDDIQVNNVSLWQSTKSWTPYASNILLTLSLATGGQPIDFSPGVDDTAPFGVFTVADNTGTKTNKMVVNYNDNTQHVTDVAWSGEWIGNHNGDYMLDPGEKIQMTIDLTYINATAPSAADKVVANHQFTLEIKSPKGAILSLQRTMPARLYGIDNLN